MISDTMHMLQEHDDALDREHNQDKNIFQLAQFALNYTSDAVIWVRHDGIICYVNNSTCQDSGYRYEELIASPVTNLNKQFAPESWNSFWEDIKKRSTISFETMIQRKDGTTYPAEVTSIHHTFQNEEYVCFFIRNIQQRNHDEEDLRRSYDELEILVQERTTALMELNEVLSNEITERKEAEEALRKSRAFLERTFSTLRDAVLTLNAERHIIACNPAALTIFGYSSQDIIGQLFHSLLAEEKSLKDFDRSLFLAFQDPGHLFERTMKRSDGTIFPSECSIAPLPDEQGKYIGWVCVVRDITERKQAEANLEKSLALLQATIESVTDGIIVTTQQGTTITSNQKFAQLWQFPHHWQESMSDEQRISFIAAKVNDPHSFLERVKTLQQNPDIEAYDSLELLDGRIIERHSVPYRVGQATAGRVWSFRDVTDRRRAEAEVRESRARLHAIFQHAAVGIGMLDLKGEFIQVNAPLANMLRGSIEELQHMNFLTIILPEGRSETSNHIQSLLQSHEDHYRGEQQIMRRDGTTFWADVSLTAVRNEEGIMESAITVITDVTQRKAAEDMVQQINMQLMQSVKDLKQRNHDTTLLNEMSDFLQSCHTLEESFGPVRYFLEQLFPNHPGAIYLKTSDGQLHMTVSWGEPAPATYTDVSQTCWALRRGRAHLVEQRESGLRCKHIGTEEPSVHLFPYICVPLQTQDGITGVLHISKGPQRDDPSYERWERMAKVAAGQVALALTNVQLRERLQLQAIRDPLTGLFNRRYLDETLKRELKHANRHQHTVGIIMLDVDHFKRFNDTYGHEAGDIVLRTVGALVQTKIRSEDIACRYGGEEFTLILPGATGEDTWNRAEELRNAIKELHIQYKGLELCSITASFGVALYPMHGTTDDEVMKAADRALYQSKAGGRDQVQVAEVPSLEKPT